MRGDVTGGSFPLAGDLTLTRMGFGAMQLAGPGVWGPPRDRGAAIRALRTVVELGLTHIDTAGFYGPDTVNDLIREALHPYPDDLHIVTKVGYRRARDRSWHPASSREDLIASVHGNLRHLGLEALDVVNFRAGSPAGRPAPGPVAEPFGVLAELQSQGLIRYLGLSNVTVGQLAEAQHVARAVCVQNQYNLAHRADDPLLDRCAEEGIAFVPFFPLGGFTGVQAWHARRRCGPARPYAAAGRSRLAAAPIPEHPADPGHVLVRAPAGQRQRRRHSPAPGCPRRPQRPRRPGGTGMTGRESPDALAWSAEPWTRHFHLTLRGGAPYPPNAAGMEAVADLVVRVLRPPG